MKETKEKEVTGIDKNNKLSINTLNIKGITLVALVVTIVVLLILARNNY